MPVMYAAAATATSTSTPRPIWRWRRGSSSTRRSQRPGVCNAAETLLLDERSPRAFAPTILAALADEGVELVGDARARAAAGESVAIGEATAEDWDTEYLALKLAVAVVDSVEEAIDHINAHGTGPLGGDRDRDAAAGDAFVAGVDAAAVYVNASTRFTDGFEFGMGAEIGNSTQKLHARGPIGMRELTTTKYVGRGNGQVRG